MEQKSHDGTAFKKSVAISDLKNEDVIKASGLNKSAFYRLYKKEVFTDEEKAAAAKALNKPIKEIFSNDRLKNLLRTATGNNSINVEDLKDSTNQNNSKIIPIVSDNELGENKPDESHNLETKTELDYNPQLKTGDVNIMIDKLIQAQADYAVAAKEDAIARRNNSEVQLRLTYMLESRVKEDAPVKNRQAG